jgi:hypothetical protein
MRAVEVAVVTVGLVVLAVQVAAVLVLILELVPQPRVLQILVAVVAREEVKLRRVVAHQAVQALLYLDTPILLQ